MIARLADILNRLGMEPTPREIAELLFLAARLSPTAERPDRVQDELPPDSRPSEKTPLPESRSEQPASLPERAQPKATGDIYLNQPKSDGASTGIGATGVRVASAIALPGAHSIEKAMRPLRRTYPSRRYKELDLERTVETTAETGVPMVINRPARERWLEAALVVDESETMRVWRPTVREFQRLLERHGAFRDVRVWGMSADGGEPAIYSRIGRIARPQRLRDPRELLDAEGRRVILVLSDCHAGMWHRGEAFKTLAEWGERAPVLLVQLLPQRLWEPTAMPRIDTQLKAGAPGLPNHRLQYVLRPDAKKDAIPMPAAVLEDWAIAPWANMVAARGKAAVKGFLIPRHWPLESVDPEEAEFARQEQEAFDKLDPLEQARRRVSEFKASASPSAFRLACYLAAVQLNFPVMRLVQQAMMPESRQSHLAEVLLGGLIRIKESNPPDNDPDDILYEFYPGVDELLIDPKQNHIDPREVLRVVAEISRLIENRLPFASEFRVMLASAKGEGEERIAPGKKAFATISPVVLRRFFGETAAEGHVARTAADEAGDALEQGDAFANLTSPNYEVALESYRLALRLYEQLGDRSGQAAALLAMAGLHARRGEHSEAIEYFDKSLRARREVGNSFEEARTLDRMSLSLHALGRKVEAIQAARQALVIFEKMSPLPNDVIEELRARLEDWEGFQLTTFDFKTVTLDERGKEIERRSLTARQFVEDLGEGIALEMVEVPGGTFLMGTADKDVKKVIEEHSRYWSKENAEGWVSRERPAHKVTVPPFFVGKYPVTQAQWREVASWPKIERDLDPDPSRFKGPDRPVEQVSWEDAKEFCARLKQRTGHDYRLPSEAEWEYACRAGTTTPFAFGETITPEIVNYDGNHPYSKAKKGKYRQETTPVGSLGVANAFGLYDMHGNVWEWVQDIWHDNYNGAPKDGSAWLSGGDSSFRGLRGGSWYGNGSLCRSADRNFIAPASRINYYGFRVVVGARAP